MVADDLIILYRCGVQLGYADPALVRLLDIPGDRQRLQSCFGRWAIHDWRDHKDKGRNNALLHLIFHSRSSAYL
jgi:hypothetical protein